MKIDLVLSQNVIPQTDSPILKVGLSLKKADPEASIRHVEIQIAPEQILPAGVNILTHSGANTGKNRIFIPEIPRASAHHVLLELPIDAKLWAMIPHKALVLLAHLRIHWQEVTTQHSRQLTFQKAIYVQKTNADIMPEENHEIALLDEIICLRGTSPYAQKDNARPKLNSLGQKRRPRRLPLTFASLENGETKTRNLASDQINQETIHPRFRFKRSGNNDSVV